MSAILWLVIFALLLVNFLQELPHVVHHNHLATALFLVDLAVLAVALGLLARDWFRSENS